MTTRRNRLSALAGTILAAASACMCWDGTADAANDAGDHGLVGRYEGSELIGRWDVAFDEVSVVAGAFEPARAMARSGDGFKTLEGKSHLFYYGLPSGRSGLEVLRNHEAGLKAKGFEAQFVCVTSDGSCFKSGQGDSGFHLGYAVGDPLTLPKLRGDYVHNHFGNRGRYLLARLDRAEGAVYASIYIGEGAAGAVAIVRIVETKEMEANKIVFIDAKGMGEAIEKAGRVNLYGLYFDFDSDKLKPESKPTLDEIAKLLRDKTELKLNIVGHTDSTGKADYNMDLSKRRAASVVLALTADYGIAEARLAASGAGATAPIAPNDDDAGRAKNRRVELVGQQTSGNHREGGFRWHTK